MNCPNAATRPTSTTTKVRDLAPSEAVHAYGRLYVGYSCLCGGNLDPRALDDAFAQLQRQHTHLGSLIRETGSGFEFATNNNPPAKVRIFAGEDPHVQATGRSAVFDQTEHLAYLDTIPSGEHTRVTLFVHHAIADAHHALALLEELWDRYTSLVENDDSVPTEPQPFPAALEYHLATREHPGGEISSGLQPPPKLHAQLSFVTRPHVLLPTRTRLSKAETKALIDHGHDTGVTINALVSAAIIQAHASPPALAGYNYVVDVRSRVTPTVAPIEATNMVRSTVFKPAHNEENLTSLARRIGDRLAADLASGVIHSGVAEAAMSAVAPEQSSSTVTAVGSNWGRIAPLRTPAGLRIIDFQSYFPPNPLFKSLEDLTGAPLEGHVITTYDQQLNIDNFAGESSDQAQPRLDRISDKLRAAIGAHT